VNHFFLKSGQGLDSMKEKLGGGVMAVKIIIDRKVKKGRKSDFAKLIRELRGKSLSERTMVYTLPRK